MKKTLFMIAIVLLGALLITGCAKEENIKEENTKKETTKEGVKLDEGKPWVYDADYNLPTEKESYMGYADESKEVKASDLIVPYININTKAAKTANEEIYGIYERLIEVFNDNAATGIWFTEVEYETYENDNIISVVIIVTSAGTGVPMEFYYTYNFDTENGKLLSYDDVYKTLGYTDENIETKVKEAIKSRITKYNIGDNSYIEQSITNYNTSVENKKIAYFIDSNKKLNVEVTLSVPVETGTLVELITLD